MDWKLVIILSFVGLMMGLLSVNGFTQKIEPVLWILFGVATALVLSKNVDQKTFLHGLIIGLAWGIFNGLTQSIFFETYLANNPQLQKNFQKINGIEPRLFVIITGPIIGLITGAVLGGLALLIKKLVG